MVFKFVLKGDMQRRAGAVRNTFTFNVYAEDVEKAIELFKAKLKPEDNFKITHIDVVE